MAAHSEEPCSHLQKPTRGTLIQTMLYWGGHEWRMPMHLWICTSSERKTLLPKIFKALRRADHETQKSLIGLGGLGLAEKQSKISRWYLISVEGLSPRSHDSCFLLPTALSCGGKGVVGYLAVVPIVQDNPGGRLSIANAPRKELPSLKSDALQELVAILKGRHLVDCHELLGWAPPQNFCCNQLWSFHLLNLHTVSGRAPKLTALQPTS